MLLEKDLVPYGCSKLPDGPYLVFAPHPDDETFGMGGAIALAVDAGIDVNVVFITDGSCDGDPAIRKREAEKVCDFLGIKNTFFWGIKDRCVRENRFILESRLGDILSNTKARTIFLPSLFEFHPDHRSSSLIIWSYLKRKAWHGEVWFYEITRHGEVNCLIAIDNVLSRKIQAMEFYESQLSRRNYKEIVLALNRTRTFTLEDVNYAEAFFALNSSDSLDKYINTGKAYTAGLHDISLDTPSNSPLVSIIVRTKERPKLLKKALGSIVAQTYRPLEVILINDGGTDLDTKELREILGDIELKYTYLKDSIGRAGAGNVGIRNAEGKYIAFLDDDDEFFSEHIDVLVHCLEELDFKGAYTSCKMTVKYFNGITKKWSNKNELLIFGQPFSYELLLFENYIPLISVMFRRSALLEIGGFDEDLNKFEDWDLLIRFASCYSLYHIDTVTCQYNSWSSSMQTLGGVDQKKSEDAYVKVLSKHFDKLTPEVLAKWQFEIRSMLEERYGRLLELVENNARELEKEFRIMEESFSRSDTELENLRSEIRIYKNKCLHLNNLLEEQRQLLGSLENEVERLSGELKAIYTSFTWKLVGKLRTFGVWLFPPGSRRRRLFSIIKHEGRFPKKAYVPDDYNKRVSIKNVSFDKPDSANFSVCFIVNHLDGGQRYRGYNMSEYLKYAGVNSTVIKDIDVPDKIDEIFKYNILVLYRLFYSKYLDDIVNQFRNHGGIVIYDIDDYIFDESALPYLNVRGVSKSELREVIKKHRMAMDLCDLCIVSTDALARIVSGTGKKAFVLRNGLSDELIRISENAYSSRVPDGDIVKIGYFSGTATHDRDFLEAADALIYVLNRNDNVKLVIGGHLKLDERFNVFIEDNRIEFLPYVHWRYLPYNLAKVDINIVPLELNAFNDAKSELKYFESAILRIPTVASPTESYQYAIENEVNGFLARNTDEWIKYLEMLIKDKKLLEQVGQTAYEHAMENYSSRSLSSKVYATYQEIIELCIASGSKFKDESI